MAFIHLFFIASMLLASMLVPRNSASDHYGTKGNVEEPKLEEEILLSTNIAVQGLVYCKSRSKLIPIPGALTRVTCEVVDEYGFETRPYSFLSEATNEKGYFLATLSPLEVTEKWVLKECRAFIDASPLDNCSYATDINKGSSGALLHSYRFLHHNNIKLYTVGPFVFTKIPTPIS